MFEAKDVFRNLCTNAGFEHEMNPMDAVIPYNYSRIGNDLLETSQPDEDIELFMNDVALAKMVAARNKARREAFK